MTEATPTTKRFVLPVAVANVSLELGNDLLSTVQVLYEVKSQHKSLFGWLVCKGGTYSFEQGDFVSERLHFIVLEADLVVHVLDLALSNLSALSGDLGLATERVHFFLDFVGGSHCICAREEEREVISTHTHTRKPKLSQKDNQASYK